jgi:hypothetical protein
MILLFVKIIFICTFIYCLINVIIKIINKKRNDNYTNLGLRSCFTCLNFTIKTNGRPYCLKNRCSNLKYYKSLIIYEVIKK